VTTTIDALRRAARTAFDAAVAAVQPRALLESAIRQPAGRLLVGDTEIPTRGRRRLLVALGKAAPAMTAAWLELAPWWPTEVLVLTPHGVPVPPSVRRTATVLHGRHPVPDRAGAAAIRDLLERTSALGSDDHLLVLLSGGASALLAAPRPGLGLDAVIGITRDLIAGGAAIGELNTVRRAILEAAGGGLARAALPAATTTLVISDVLGNPLHDIASGPTVASPTGAAEAAAVLERRLDASPARDRVLGALAGAEPVDPAAGGALDHPDRRHVVVLADNSTARRAAARHLGGLTPDVVEVDRPLVGDARQQGIRLGALAASARPDGPTAVVLGGETTVTVTGPGRGGRCQELALAAALRLVATSGPCVVLAAGTDGIDGASDNAGAVVDPGTLGRLAARGIDPVAALAANDSATALTTIGDALVTGPTGTNVCDLIILLWAPAQQQRSAQPTVPGSED
jgi:glycerate-2-kinase